MFETVSRKKFLSWLVVLSMMIPMLIPVLSYAQTMTSAIYVDGTEYDMTYAPVRNELGLVVSAKDISQAFGFEYDFDAANKAFTIYHDEYGKIVFMHNATSFYSNGNIYDCNPYFYVSNGEPFVELGFFCNVFLSSYVCDEESKEIFVSTGVISSTLPRISYDGNITPLYIEPVETEYGLITRVVDLANCIGVDVHFDEASGTAMLTDESGMEIELTDGATTFKSSGGEFECGPFFTVKDGVPMIETGFFCDLYAISYSYDSNTKTLNIYSDMTMEEKAQMDSVSLMSSSYISGNVTYSDDVPEDGIDVKLVLQQIGSRYQIYQGYSYYLGNTYTIDTISFEEGASSQYYYCDISEYASYPYFSLLYEDSANKKYGYYNIYGLTSAISRSPLSNPAYYSGAKHFSFGTNTDVNLVVGDSYLRGTVELDENVTAPEGGVDVGLILQTRSKNYNSMYGSPYYYIGYNNNIGTVSIPYGSSSAEYKLDITDCFKGSSYNYYSMYYSSTNCDFVKPYGYCNNLGGTTPVTSIPSGSSCSYTSARIFDYTMPETANFVIPIWAEYVPEDGTQTAEAPKADTESGHVPVGTQVTLSTGTSYADIYYTTDGRDPAEAGELYKAPITIEKDMVIKAVSVVEGVGTSAVSTYQYIADDDSCVKFIVGEDKAFINGNTISLDVAPIENYGKVFVPIRAFGESLGACVEWNSDKQMVLFTVDDKSLELYVDGENCFIIDGRTMADAGLVMESLLGDEYIVETTPISVYAKLAENAPTEDEPVLMVQNAKVIKGRTVDVVFEVYNNPGIAVLGFDIGYDEYAMTLQSVTVNDVFDNSDVTPGNMSRNPYTFSAMNAMANSTTNGSLVTLTFLVSDNCAEGEYDIIVTNPEAYSIDEKPIDFEVVNGIVTVRDVEPGDVNGDGSVNRLDTLRLGKYLAGWDVEIDDMASDVTADGKVNRLDLLRLGKFFAGWDVTLGE